MASANTQLKLIMQTKRESEPITVCFGCPEQAYIEFTVPSSFANVKSITFKTTSHDQGFSGVEDQYRVTYEQCCSFFDGVITTPEGHTRKRGLISTNRHAMIEPFTHVCTWPDAENEEFLTQVLHEMRENDIIQIIPKAHYRAWRNFVLEAEITITGESKESQLEEMSGKKIDGSIPSPLTLTAEDFYVPLNQSFSEIRVLRLLPGPPSTKISCMLWHTQLKCDYPSQFEALSYCWGNPKHTKTIRLAGHDIQVTSNLFDALHRLRTDDGVTQNLWVDNLCINQKNLEERSWQVQMMGQVYAAASRVIVWLGEPSLNFYAAEVGRLFKVFDEEKDSMIDDYTTESPDVEYLSQEELRNTVPKYKGVRVFFENVWFSRIWVLQEVFNARKILVRCGDRAFSWSLVLKINENVRRTLSEPAPQYHKAMPPLFSGLFALTRPTQVLKDDICSNISARFGYTPRAPTENILNLVVAGFSLEATDPRDKLFALLGFIGPKYHHLEVLRPNYEKDVAIVYRDFTRWWIASHRSLRILSAIHCSKGRTWQRLSAYVPSFRGSKHTSWSLWYDGMSAWGRATLGLSPSIEGPGTSGNMELDTSLLLESNGNSLLLKGIMLGIIHDIEAFPYGLAALYNEDPSAPSISHREHYERVFDPLNQRAIFSSSSQGGSEVPLESPIPPADLVYDHMSTHESYAWQNGGALECHPQCYFSTIDKKSGLCPNAAKKGDYVVVLFGGTIPYVVRSVHDIEVLNGSEDGVSEVSTSDIRRRRVELVGECFLDGYMNGEAIQKKQGEVVEFELV